MSPPPATPVARRVPLLLLLLFIAPLLLAYAMYYGWHWRPPGQTNHGTLIEPPRRLQTAGASAVFQGRWSLVYIGAGECDANCRYALYFMRQTHFGLGKNIPRVQRVFIATGHCCDRAFLEREHPGLITLTGQGQDGAALLAQFPQERRASTLFIVDPLGNIMMRYDVHADPRGLHDDLQKLLTLSHIG
ncbi:MAG TPA: hypothetical protein VIX87_07985 [Steroidobacteraceae bacterium]